jgi:hypothetical protein
MPCLLEGTKSQHTLAIIARAAGLEPLIVISLEEVLHLRSASNHPRSRLDVGEALGTDKYQTKNVCTNGLFRQD